MTRRVLVTGASSGIGAASVRTLCKEGLQVIATARRAEKLAALAAETGAQQIAADITQESGRQQIVDFVHAQGKLDVLINCAGGALGQDPVAVGDPEEWRAMYELNVIAPLRMTQAFLPEMRAHGGDIVFISSTAGHATYPGGAGYVAAKHAERQISATLRLELVGEPVRIIDIAPGMVKTEEFSLRRFHGDKEKAAQVYAGVEKPLTAEDIAETIRWAVTLPAHVNIDTLVVRPVAQASNLLVARKN